MTRTKSTYLALLAVFLLPITAQATLLGLVFEDTPDIVSAFIDVN